MAKKRAGGTANDGNGSTAVLAVPVEFGGVSIGDQVARIGVKVSRERLNINAADDALCGKRLTGRIVRGDFNPAQKTLFDDVKYEVAGAFDVKRFGVNTKEISFGLSFSVESIDIGELSHLAKQTGGLVVDAIEAIPEEAASDSEEEGEGGEEDED